MVLAFTEEQKKEIEANGMTVIEFKRCMIRLGKTLESAYVTLKEFFDKIIEVVKPIIENLCEIFDNIKLAVDEIRNIKGYPTSRRYTVCKILSKRTGIEKRELWKMTRHTWLARSCC